MKHNKNQNIKTKFKFRLILSILNFMMIAVVLVYSCAFGIKNAKEFVIYNKKTEQTVIYSIWHIETFEGGGKARINYLKSIARQMEKENPTILFHIQQIAPENLNEQLLENMPDIISFGQGVGKLILDKAVEFNNCYDVRQKLVEAGSFNKKVYALAYIVSGYAMFSHGEKENCIEYGNSGYINPQNALKNAQKPIKQFGTQFETYKNFVYHHDHALLGTARDVFRIDNLNKIGRTNASITPIDSYTDLVQYIAKTRTDETIEKFCARVLSADYQKKLADYHLFSSLSTKLYFDGIYNDMENAIFNCNIQSAFNY